MSSESAAAAVLPPEFEDLAGFANWALPTETQRQRKRLASSMDDMQRVYTALSGRIDAILEHLNGFDLHDLPEAEQNLLNLAFALAEVSFAVEVYGQPEVTNSFQEYGGRRQVRDRPRAHRL